MAINAAPGPNYLEGTTMRDGLRDIIDREYDRVATTVADWLDRGLDQLYMVGCGGSLAVQEPVKWLMDRYSPLPTDIYTGWEFVNRAPRRLGEHSAVVLASHSGTTEEVLQGLKLAQERGARTISLSRLDTTLSNGAEVALTYNTRAVNLAKLLMSHLIGAQLIRLTGDQQVGERLLKALSEMPDSIHAIKEASAERGRALAAKYKDAKGFYVVGSGGVAGMAYQFSICTLLEMQWLHSAAINAGEFRHGPFEIVDKGLPMIFLLGNDASRAISERALAFAQRYGAETLVFDVRDLPAVDPDLPYFAVNVALQQFAWALATERQHPLAVRRYMGKVAY